jgi:hypothetical protein
MPQDIQSRVTIIREKISEAANRSGRSPNDIKLLAATKTRNIKEIVEALNAGVDLVGENRMQEALAKFEFLPPETQKHMIGTLQPNKVRSAVQLFDLIQSVNSIELAILINNEAHALGVNFPILLEVNAGEEASKMGAQLDSIDEIMERVSKLENIEIHGLMAMVPHNDDVEQLRPFFAKVRRKFEELQKFAGSRFVILSMGMSNDYEIAIEEGSTMIRLGTTIFGPRIK